MKPSLPLPPQNTTVDTVPSGPPLQKNTQIPAFLLDDAWIRKRTPKAIKKMLYSLIGEGVRLKRGVLSDFTKLFQDRRADHCRHAMVVLFAWIQCTDQKSFEVLQARDHHGRPIHRDHDSIRRWIRERLGVSMHRATYYAHIKNLLRLGLIESKRRYTRTLDRYYARTSEKRLGRRLLFLLGVETRLKERAEKRQQQQAEQEARELASIAQAERQLKQRPPPKDDWQTSLNRLKNRIKSPAC